MAQAKLQIRSFILLILVGLLTFSLSGCAQGKSTDSVKQETSVKTTAETKLIVFAASSLTESFNKIAEEFKKSHPNVKIILNYAGTPTLQQQLENGATADVFASANETHMQAILGENLVEQPQDFATNKLVVITSKRSPIHDLKDLAEKSYHLVVANSHVPVGGYTLKALDNLNKAYNSDFKANVLKHVVSQETNVKQVVAKVQLGEADAGFVYSSDVTPAVREQIQIISIPAQYNVVAHYPIAVVKTSAHKDLAKEFIHFLISASGQKIMADFGFSGQTK